MATGRSVSTLVQMPLADKYASRKKVDSPEKNISLRFNKNEFYPGP